MKGGWGRGQVAEARRAQCGASVGGVKVGPRAENLGQRSAVGIGPAEKAMKQPGARVTTRG